MYFRCAAAQLLLVVGSTLHERKCNEGLETSELELRRRATMTQQSVVLNASL